MPGAEALARLRAVLLSVLAMLALAMTAVSARAAQDDLFTVSGITVDVRAQDAAQAKVRAILQAQRRAFFRLAERLAGKKAPRRLAGLDDRDIGRLMSSLSISDERAGANRYIATLAVRFNPRKVVRLLRGRGLSVITTQAPPVLVIPVWEDLDGIRVFRDNPWLRAWREVADENALQPVIVPAGDDIDRGALDPVALRDGVEEALQPYRLRYGVEHVLVAFARPLGNGVQAAMVGTAPGGRVAFDKEYAPPATEDARSSVSGGAPEDAAALLAASRFLEVLTDKWRRKQAEKARAATRARAEAEAARRAAAALTVVVPFRSLREWQALRARLRANPAIAALDVQALSGNHAVVSIVPRVAPALLASELARSRLDLRVQGGQWYLRAY